jgi:transposase
VDFKKYFIHKTHKCKITKEYIEYLLNLVKNDTFICIKGIKNKLKDKFNISISDSSIRNILQKNGITFKKIYKQINPYTEKELKKQQKIIKNKINKAGIENIKSIDEFSIHFNEQPKYTW